MSTRRWVRIDVGWAETEWVDALSAEAQLAWIKLICHAKSHGVGGRVKIPSLKVIAKRWKVRVRAIEELVEAGRIDGAIYEDSGDWVLTAWNAYQPDPTAAQRQAESRARRRHGVSQ